MGIIKAIFQFCHKSYTHYTFSARRGRKRSLFSQTGVFDSSSPFCILLPLLFIMFPSLCSSTILLWKAAFSWTTRERLFATLTSYEILYKPFDPDQWCTLSHTFSFCATSANNVTSLLYKPCWIPSENTKKKEIDFVMVNFHLHLYELRAKRVINALATGRWISVVFARVISWIWFTK